MLLCHGRESYRKNTFLIIYMFYKNVMYVIPVWFFGFFSLFSGQAIYDNWMYQLYNVIFTFMPICWFAVFDWEASKEKFLEKPKLYKIGLEDIYFNNGAFWRIFFYACFSGVFVWLIGFTTLDTATNFNGTTGSLWVDGQFCFTAVVIIVNFKVLIASSQWTCISLFWIFGSILSYLLCFYGLSAISLFDLFGVF